MQEAAHSFNSIMTPLRCLLFPLEEEKIESFSADDRAPKDQYVKYAKSLPP
jgi:hypothetical protein